MYGGLFGDLPAAKKNTSGSNENDGDDDETSHAAQNAAGSDSSGKTKSGSQSTTEGTDADTLLKHRSTVSSSVATNSGLFPLGATHSGGRKKARLDDGISASSHQFLQTVGRAGTSMAFIPTAAMKRKPSANSKQPANRAPIRELETPAITNSGLAPDISGMGSSIALFPSTDMGDITTTIVRKKPSSGINIYGGSSEHGIKDTTLDEKNQEDGNDCQLLVARLSQQNQEMRATETSNAPEITDPYDPYIPNDLLQYWERQALAQERERLERETKEAIEKQKLLRERLELERQELQQSGNYQELIHQQTTPGADVGPAAGVAIPGNAFGDGGMGRGRGRGRGRGVSNLPAWLVEKQRQLQEKERLGGGESAPGGAGDDE